MATPAEHAPTPREVDAYRSIARRHEGDRIAVCTFENHLDVIVTGVHAGASEDVRTAYLTGRAAIVPVQVRVTAAMIARGIYWLHPAAGEGR